MRIANPEAPTKKKLMEVSHRLMAQKGYGATTVDEICLQTGVSKGSFFHYFKNKQDLCKQLIEDYGKMSWEKIETKLAGAGKDPLKRVLAYMDFFTEVSRQPGAKSCLIGTLTQELSKTNPELRDCCAASFKQFGDHFREDLVRAKMKHKPKMRFDVNSLADHFISTVQGSLLLTKAKDEA